jgi:hypothetical protein
MNAGRTFRRTVRPLWIAGLATAAWVNRANLRRALGASDGHPDDAIAASTGDRITRRTTTTAFVWPSRRSHRRTTLHGATGAAAAQPVSVVETIVETGITETGATS